MGTRGGLRGLISADRGETVVFAVDVPSDPPSPDYWLNINPLIYAKCSRALPMADQHDIVVLSGPLYLEYYDWLRSLRLGPSRVVAYGVENPGRALSDLILENPEPVLREIVASGRRPVYVPFFSGDPENKVATALNASIFGATGELSMRFHSKERFKERCAELGVPVVKSLTDGNQTVSGEDLEKVVSALLRSYGTFLVRGTVGSAGSSVYRVESVNVQEVVSKLQQQQGGDFLIEPFLKVVASPNDQWCISRSGELNPIGTSAQLFSGLKHVGNIKGQLFSNRVFRYISTTSEKIARSMAHDGYRGVIGIDYIVTDEGIFPIENNARLNGSTFAFGITSRLALRGDNYPCWKFFKGEVAPCSFTPAS